MTRFAIAASYLFASAQEPAAASSDRIDMTFAADFTEGWTSPKNRRRYAAVLVAAWAVFWLVLVGQACCEVLAATPDRTKSQSTSDASHLTGHAHPDGHGADNNPDCPEVTALDARATDATAATVDRPLVASLASGDVTFAPTRDADSLQRALYGTPPPLIALYLRNLHLLI